MGPGWIGASGLFHVALYALIFLAAWQREKPPEPLPPPSYEMVFDSGAPERPREQADTPPGEPEPPTEAAPTPPVPPSPPAVAQALPPPPPPMVPPPVPAPPQVQPPTAPRLAERLPPLPAEPPPPPDAEALPAPPRLPAPPQPQQAEPRPPEAPRLAESLPPPPPPMPAPPEPRQQQTERLPGLYLPHGMQLSPTPPSMAQRRPQGLRGLDLTLGPTIGRSTIDPQMDIRGAQVGPDWRNAFRRWLEEHKRYPQEAIVLNQQGITRIQIVAAPDGRVIGAKLVRRSGSVWLDNNTEQLFRGARLPPFPPGADANGVNIDLTIHYILIRN